MYESVTCVQTPVGKGTSVYKLPAVCMNCRDIYRMVPRKTYVGLGTVCSDLEISDACDRSRNLARFECYCSSED